MVGHFGIFPEITFVALLFSCYLPNSVPVFLGWQIWQSYSFFKNTKVELLKKLWILLCFLFIVSILIIGKNISTCCTITCRCVNLKSWDEAETKYPGYARDEALEKFLTIKIRDKNGLTDIFKEFCQAAVNSLNKESPEITVNGSKVYFVQTPYTEFTKDTISEAMPSFKGAALIISGDCKQVCDTLACIDAPLYVSVFITSPMKCFTDRSLHSSKYIQSPP